MQILIKIGIILSLAPLVFGCLAGNTNYAGGDKITYSEINKAAERGEIEKTLEEPSIIREVAGLRIEAYEIYGGTRALYIWPAIFIPTDSKFSYLTIAYKEDGTLVGVKTWPGASSPEDAMEMHVNELAEISRLQQICEIPISEAHKLSDEEIDSRYIQCGRREASDRQNVMMWSCLSASRGYVAGQYDMGQYFEDRHQVSGLTSDLTEAYKWYSLALAQETGGEYRRARVVSKLTASELSEAKQLVVDWQPNPSECEANSPAEAGSALVD